MGLLTRPAPATPAPQAQLLNEDERALRERLDALETQIRAIDDQMHAAQGELDAAEALIQAIQSRGGLATEMWRAEEARDRATAVLAELLNERRPLTAERNRLSAYVRPIDAQRAEIDSITEALPAWEKLAEILPLLDQICATVAEADELGRTCRRDFSIPPTVAKLVRTLGRGGWDRHRVEETIRATVAGHRTRISQLDGGAR